MYNRMMNYALIAGVMFVFILLVGGIGESKAAGFVKLSAKLTKEGYQKKRADLHISKRCKTGIADKLDELNDANNDLGKTAEKLDEIKERWGNSDDTGQKSRYMRDYDATYKKMVGAYFDLVKKMSELDKLIKQASKKKKLLKCYAKTRRKGDDAIDKKEEFVSFLEKMNKSRRKASRKAQDKRDDYSPSSRW